MEGCCHNMKIVSSNTPQGGLGQIDPFTAAQAGNDLFGEVLGFVTGLFKKDPDKIEYDRVRQQAWDYMASLMDQVDNNYKANGTLTRSILQQYIDSMDQLMKGFKSYTDKMIASGTDSAWIDPRFHDYYDFMNKVKTAWQQELAMLPADYVGDVWDYFTGNDVVITGSPFGDTSSGITKPPINQSGFSGTSMLLIGGVALGLILMSRKR